MFLKLLAGFGLSIPSGLNAFLPLLLMAVLAKSHKLTIFAPFNFLANWTAIIVLALLVGLEIFLDKLPQIARLHSNINLLLRPIAGGIAFAAVMPPDQLPQGVSFLIGAALAEAMHLITHDVRPAIANSSETAKMFEPMISLLQDGVAFMLALITIFLPVVGGPLAILVLIFSYVSSLRLKKKVSVK